MSNSIYGIGNAIWAATSYVAGSIARPFAASVHVGLGDMNSEVIQMIASQGLSPNDMISLAHTSRALHSRTTEALANGTELSITDPQQLWHGTGPRARRLYVNIPLPVDALSTIDTLRWLFRRFPNLAHLELGPIARESLKAVNTIELSQPSVTDVGVQAIVPNCPNLHHLYLYRARVTDTSVQTIAASCPNLQYLGLPNAGVTDECIAVAMSLNGHLEITR